MMKYWMILWSMACLCSLGALELPRFYGDNMVLQANRPLALRGSGTPGETVRVEIDGAHYSGVADAGGHWQVQLGPHGYGEGYELKIAAPSSSRTIRNVAFGEVWLASGQSNMQMTLAQTDGAAQAIAASADPGLRVFTVKPTAAVAPLNDVEGSWAVSAPGTAKNFTAAGYYFAVELRRELNVPVGIIAASWGGTAVESWMAPALLGELPETKARYMELRQALPVVERSPRELNLDDSGWMREDVSTEGWSRQARRIHWDYELYPIEYNGVIWARKEVELPPDWAGRDVTLSLGTVDDYETTYFNGEEVGGTARHTLARRVYEIPGKLVRSGKNTIAVKTFKFGWGGLTGPENIMFLQLKGTDGKVPIGGEWLYRASKLEFKGISQRLPGTLYNGMIAPLTGYGIRGVIWYQGEANAYVPAARAYRNIFGAMITDWRKAFGQVGMPFYYVQLAGFRNRNGEGWPLLRDAQRRTLELPGTGMASAIDIGEAGDIHPKNKKDVGVRLARWALANTYGKKLVPGGPLYREMKIEGDKVRVYFDYADGLRAGNGSLRYFELSGRDGKFHPAAAEISGDTVLVSAKEVAAPTAVRYCWLDYPEYPNLYNSAGLPASPFISE